MKQDDLLVKRLWFKTKRFFLQIASILMIIWSLIWFVAMLANGGSPASTTIIMIFLFSVLPFGVAMFVRSYLKKTKHNIPKLEREEEESDQIEKVVLVIAASQEGLVTPADIALRSEYSLEEAKQYLESLREQGFANLKIAENGTYVYYLPYILSHEQKKNAEGI